MHWFQLMFTGFSPTSSMMRGALSIAEEGHLRKYAAWPDDT
jgi:hypothetical protein